jgi:resuscitation-promoting factor RpfA
MAITGIDALTGFGFNQSNTQSLTQAPQPASEKPANIGGAATSQDQFTPSALTGQQNTSQAAGLFTVTQFAPFTAAADAFLAAAPTVLINQETAALNVNPATVPANHNLFAQPAALQGNPAAPTVTVAPTVAPNTFLARPAALQGNPAAPNITAAPKDIAGAPVLGFAANQAAPSAPNANTAPLAAPVAVAANATAQAGGTATPPASPAAGTTNAATTGSASIAEQLQALNTALQALGLGPRDIHQIDQIASVIKDFNPAAFTSLAYQLAALASPAATQQPPASAATAGLGRP